MALQRDRRGVVVAPEGVHNFMRAWIEEVNAAWKDQWQNHESVKTDNPHRYSRDPGAFIGERLVTDFDLDRRSFDKAPGVL